LRRKLADINLVWIDIWSLAIFFTHGFSPAIPQRLLDYFQTFGLDNLYLLFVVDGSVKPIYQLVPITETESIPLGNRHLGIGSQ
jgi:hypothetical protein